MEQFDELLKKLNTQKIVDRILTLGYPIDQNHSVRWSQQKTMNECLSIANLFVKQHEQQSIINFMVDVVKFIRLKSKKDVGKFCFDLVYSLQHNSETNKELSTILMLFCVDYAQDLLGFYVESRCHMIEYFTLSNQNYLLDDLNVTLDDWVTLCGKIFCDNNTRQMIDKMTKLISPDIALKSNFDPYKILTGGRYQQVCIKLYMDLRKQDPMLINEQDIIKAPQQPNQNLEVFQGFYRWSSPLFKREEFLKNPQNLKMLSQLKIYRQKYPIESINRSAPGSPKPKIKNIDNKLTPVKQENPSDRQNLRRELSRQIKEKNASDLKFNLLLSCYQNMKVDQIHMIKKLEIMYERYESLQAHDYGDDYNLEKSNLQQQKEEINNYERHLRKLGLLPASFLDDLFAAGKRQFQENKPKIF